MNEDPELSPREPSPQPPQPPQPPDSPPQQPTKTSRQESRGVEQLELKRTFTNLPAAQSIDPFGPPHRTLSTGSGQLLHPPMTLEQAQAYWSQQAELLSQEAELLRQTNPRFGYPELPAYKQHKATAGMSPSLSLAPLRPATAAAGLAKKLLSTAPSESPAPPGLSTPVKPPQPPPPLKSEERGRAAGGQVASSSSALEKKPNLKQQPLSTKEGLIIMTKNLMDAIEKARTSPDPNTRCMTLPPRSVLSWLDSLHDLLHARIESLTDAEAVVRKYLCELYNGTLGFTVLPAGFPNELLQLLTTIQPAQGPPPLVCVKAASNIERHAHDYFLQRKKLDVSLFPDVQPYLRTCLLDYSDLMSATPVVLEEYRKKFNHFKISDDNGELAGILKDSSRKNKLGDQLLKLKFKGYAGKRVGLFLDGGHGFVVSKAFSGLVQVQHCMTQATKSDSSPQSPIFPRQTRYFGVGEKVVEGKREFYFFAVDPENIPFCANEGISVWFETREFNSKVQDFDIVVFDSEKQLTIRYNLRDIGQGPSVSDIMLFFKELYAPGEKKFTTPPRVHLNMFNCKITDSKGDLVNMDNKKHVSYVTDVLRRGWALALKGMGDISQFEAMLYLKKTQPALFDHWDFLTCDRLCALHAYLRGCVSELAYGTTCEIFIPIQTDSELTQEERDIIEEERNQEMIMMKKREDTARMLLLIEQIEGKQVAGGPIVEALKEVRISLVKQLIKNKESLLVHPPPERCSITVRALASVEVTGLLKLVDGCCDAADVGISFELIQKNWTELTKYADSDEPDKELRKELEPCIPVLKQMNSFNEQLLLLFNGKISKNIEPTAIADMIRKAARVDYFNCRQPFSPFGFNGSMYGRLLISLTKLDDSKKIVNDRFKNRFIQDIKNSGLYKELEYVMTRFSEMKIENPQALELLKMLRKIKEITGTDGLVSLFTLLDQAADMGVAIITASGAAGGGGMGAGAAGEMGAVDGSARKSAAGIGVIEMNASVKPAGGGGGMMVDSPVDKISVAGAAGGEMDKQDGGRKRTIMKGGAMGSLEKEEINIIYHNLSSQICCSLIRNLIFDGDGNFDILPIEEIIRQGAGKLTDSSPDKIDTIYDMFIVIVSRYVNSLMDMKLSGLLYEYTYKYEHESNPFILIERLFMMFSHLLPPVQLPVILPLFPTVSAKIGEISQYTQPIQSDLTRSLIIDLLVLSLIIKPYSDTEYSETAYSETDKILYFSQVEGKIFKDSAKDDRKLLPVDPMATYNLLTEEFARYDPMASGSQRSTQTFGVSPLSTASSPETQLKLTLPSHKGASEGAGVSVSRSVVTPVQLAEQFGIGHGGSSTRTLRRRLRRNHRRTQYTNKHKRSSKSTKHATIKRRKSYRKHKHTVKHRKSRRHHQ